MKPLPSGHQRWKAFCAYDGNAFAGWQSQVCGNAVQDVLEAALAKIFKKPIRIHGSGRTDSGVHARGQVFHFDAVWRADIEALQTALNLSIPPEVRVWKLVPHATAQFHARYSVVSKEYQYQVLTRPPDPFEHRFWWYVPREMDPHKIEAGMILLTGTHDFTSFAARVTADDQPVKTLLTVELRRRGPHWTFVFHGSGFLYKMVRSLVGSLVMVGQGKMEVSRIPELLEEKKRTQEVFTAPPHGLFLQKANYRKLKP